MNRFFVNVIDLFSGSKAKASDIEAHFNLITTGFDGVQTEMDLKSPLASPSFTGVPVAPTAAPGTNTPQLATTAYVTASTAAEAGVRLAADNLEIAARISNDNLEIAARMAEDALKAPLASPALTGTPTAPTASAGASTTQIATTAFVTATAFSAVVPGQTGNAGKFLSTNGTNAAWISAGVANYPYDNRATLRTLSPSAGDAAIVKGLGLFIWEPASTEPDDDESAFATTSGVWLLEAAGWDLVDSWQAPDQGALTDDDEDEPLRFATSFATSFATKILTGSATCAITSVATVASAGFTGTVTGAAIGDRVVATPPAQLGDTAGSTGYLSYHAWVSAANTVTVMLTNAGAAAANTNPAIRADWPITVIKT